MKISALIAALIAAVVGAAVWAVISTATGYELGYAAWGIGLLVGFAAKLAGSNDKATAVACALLALLSIFAGKLTSMQYVVEHELRDALEQIVIRELYEKVLTDAADFARVKSEDEYPAFMIEYGYGDASSPEQVSAEDLAYFRAIWVDRLRECHTNPPPYEEWREKYVQSAIDRMRSEYSALQLVVENLRVFDVVFALLGLVTAYQVAAGKGSRDELPPTPTEEAGPPDAPPA